MRRSEIGDRARLLTHIRCEIQKHMLQFLREHREEVFTVGEILDRIGLGPEDYRQASPRFSAPVYCADYNDIVYCAAEAASLILCDELADLTMIGNLRYYGAK